MLQQLLLESVLGDFGVRGAIINAHPGPVVTLYELEPAPGIKSSRVIGLSDDIARSMSALSARVAVVSGRNAIGIELPNQNTVHGMRLQKFPRTGYVFCNGEYEVPIPNDGNILDAPDKYWSIFSAIDGDTMKVAWQVMVDGNLDNTDADYQAPARHTALRIDRV